MFLKTQALVGHHWDSYGQLSHIIIVLIVGIALQDVGEGMKQLAEIKDSLVSGGCDR